MHKWGYVHLRKPYNIWYARYTVDRPYSRGYDLTRPISLGLRGGPEGVSKTEAERVALERRPKNLRAQVSKPLAQTLTVRALATGFWEPDSDFCERRANHFTAYSRVYLDHNKGLTDRFIIPALGQFTLGELAPVIIDDISILLRNPMYKATSLDDETRERVLHTLTDEHGKVRALGPDEVNQILNCLRDMYKELSLRDKSFKAADNPVKVVARHSNPNKRKRGILRDDESAQLYDESKINERWDGSQVMYTIALLAASTSMREGEIRALQRQHVHLVPPFLGENGVPANGPWLMVRWNWQDKYGLAPTKTKRTRNVPLDPWTADWLGRVMSRSPYQDPEDLVFAGNADKRALRGYDARPGRTPVDGHWIRDCFYAALSKIGIEDAERRQRNIVFHSSRHYFVTRARNLPNAKDRQVQDITGQETLSVVDNYSHNEVDDTRHIVEGVVDKFRSASVQGGKS